MKIKILSRSEKGWTRQRNCDSRRVHRNLDPRQTPMATEIEYQRALTAVKLERMFAKPFIASLQHHVDSISSLTMDSNHLSVVLSGSCDGGINVWNIARRKLVRSIPNAHRHFVCGLTSTPDSTCFLSCSTDKTVRLWNGALFRSNACTIESDNMESLETDSVSVSASIPFGKEHSVMPSCEYTGIGPFSSIDHSAIDSQFVTTGSQLELWDITRSQPIRSFQWGPEPVLSAKYNRIEPHLVAFTSADRGISVYDIRTSSAMNKVVMEMKSGCLSWNPVEPASLLCGNHDWNVYLFDIRNFSKAQAAFTSHTASVTDVDFSPTGKEFVSCSYDRTLRLWNLGDMNSHQSRDMYHTKRMHKCWSVRWSLDNQYIVSGSEDACIRLWKADSSALIRPVGPTEKRKLNYRREIKRRYLHFPEIRRIDRQRQIPKYIRTAHRVKKQVLTNRRKKQYRIQKNNPGLADENPQQSMRESKIVTIKE